MKNKYYEKVDNRKSGGYEALCKPFEEVIQNSLSSYLANVREASNCSWS